MLQLTTAPWLDFLGAARCRFAMGQAAAKIQAGSVCQHCWDRPQVRDPHGRFTACCDCRASTTCLARSDNRGLSQQSCSCRFHCQRSLEEVLMRSTWPVAPLPVCTASPLQLKDPQREASHPAGCLTMRPRTCDVWKSHVCNGSAEGQP